MALEFRVAASCFWGFAACYGRCVRTWKLIKMKRGPKFVRRSFHLSPVIQRVDGRHAEA